MILEASPFRHYKILSAALVICGSILPTLARAELVIEPVFQRGPANAENAVGVQQAVVGIQSSLGLSPLWTAQPNEVFSYVTGNPRNEALDNLYFINDTNYDLNGFGLAIIGTGVDTDDPRTITRGAPINARFGDVDGDGKILSDIFASYSISADGKQIQFSDGFIKPGERFTDIHLATSTQSPDMAGIDSWFTGTISNAALCKNQGDPVAAAPFNLVDAYCIAPSFEIGEPGQPAHVRGVGTFPANQDGVLDVFVIWEPKEIGVGPGESFTYSSELTWSNRAPSAVVREWVGNFNGGAVAYPITNTADAIPTEMVKTATSAMITDRTFEASQFPGDIGRYHIKITGLQPGELVTFSKSAAGGHVTPEPSGAALVPLLLALVAQRRQARKRQLSAGLL